MKQEQFDALNKTNKERIKLEKVFKRQLNSLLARVNKSKANPREHLWVKNGSGLAGPYRYQKVLESGKVGLEMIETGSDRNVTPEVILVGADKASATPLLK